ncbi:MAG: insulinase family protein [Pirellulaceae bacterium]|jgi:zinc protease|nr:insulinase family protein [Pirellulaceae bacterium]
MRLMTWMIFLCTVLVTLATGADAQPLPTDPALVTGQLDNGLRYVIRQHANPPGRAALWLHIHSGSLNETDPQRGLAHYLEHMAFNGSENFPPGSVVPFFQSLGMTFGRDQNAFTSFDQTTYQLALPRVDREALAQGMTFLADVLSRLSLLPAEIESERQIIQEERRRSLSGQQRTMYYMLERIAPGSIFGQRITIGTEETINSVQRADFQDYYGRWYVPSNATLLIVADSDPAQILQLITEHFAPLPTVARPTPQEIGVTAYTESFAIVASDSEVPTEQIRITRIEPARPATTTVAQWRDDLVTTLGVVALNRRLQDKIATGQTSYVSGGVSAGNQAGALYTADLDGRARPGKWREALAELAAELQRGRLYGFSPQELDDAVKEIRSGLARNAETESTQPAGTLLRQMNQAIAAGEPIMGAAQQLQLLNQLTPTITPDEVAQRFAAEFDPTAVCAIAILPASADVPTESELLELATRSLAVRPERETPQARPTQLLASLPEPGTVSELTEHAASGVWSCWLSNNVRAHYRFMDTRKNDVTVRITLLGGELHETAEDRGVTQSATVAWMQPATRGLTSSDIRSLMTGKKISVRGGVGGSGGDRGGMASGASGSISLTVTGSPDDLESGLQLAHLLLTAPRVEPAAFEQFTTVLRTTLQGVEKNPLQAGMLAAAAAPYPEDVARTQPVTIAQVDRLAAAAAQTRLDQLIAQSPIEVAVVGDLPRDRALELVARYLGSLPSRPRIAPDAFAELRQLDRPRGPRAIHRTIESETPQAVVYCGFYGSDETNLPDTRALNIAAMILTTRMIKEIREEEQLVYSIRAGFRPGTTYPGFGTMAAVAPTDPAKAQRLLDKINAMFTSMAKAGITDEELSVAKKQIANTLDEQMRDPAYWLSRLAQLTFDGFQLDDIVQAPAAYEAISAAQVQETFARYFAPEASVALVVEPAAP